MSKIETIASELPAPDLERVERPLRDDELEAIYGGFGFIEKSFGFIRPAEFVVLPPHKAPVRGGG
jgi:hypothetical protein